MVVAIHSLSYTQLEELKKFGDRVSRLGANFAAVDAGGEVVVLRDGRAAAARRELLRERCVNHVRGYDQVGDSDEWTADHGILVTSLSCHGALFGAIGIDIGVEGELERLGIQGMSASAVLGELMELFAEKFEMNCSVDSQISVVSTELAQVYEELVLLHKLSSHMRVTEPDANFLQMACDSLTDIVLVEGIAVLVERNGDQDGRWVLAAGSGVIDADEQSSSLFYSRLLNELKNGKDALLDSEIDRPFKYEWPESIKSVIAVPLCGNSKGVMGHGSAENIVGMMVAINRLDKADFDSTDVKLFDSVANSCAVFIENGRLFSDLKDLFIGSLKALTSSIDAKDQYTRGHSERVAFISKWIAERCANAENMSDEEIHRVYLAGLLHDIGKMGVQESVLCKDGRLTEEEYAHIRRHPVTGAQILSGMKQMREIVPGVLCHHERIDGKGYPNNLKGDDIPLIGRIICLADSFDAMTSKRVYRSAMNVSQAMEEIEKGLGTQFDERIGRLFLDSNVDELWEIMQQGYDREYRSNDFSEYGARAVGTLVR